MTKSKAEVRKEPSSAANRKSTRMKNGQHPGLGNTEVLLSRKKKLINNTSIPEYVIESVARCLMPDILSAFEDMEVQEEFAAWQAEQKQNVREVKRKAA